ncbi:MAG: hypothetical protein LBR23_05505 [Spirochaetaceae bacterium]|jgi:hypothetical protein|nr:hypothetical protein [Spirochaetaceae bacterium]
MADDFSFEITQKYGELGKGKGGWPLELNMVSWNHREPKYDIRSWSEDHQKMGKGCTFTEEELRALKGILDTMFT